MIKNCENCGKEYKSNVWFSRTCSDACRMALSRKNRKAQQPKAEQKPQPKAGQ